MAATLRVGAGLAASALMVSAGEAIVVTQFGAVTRVITEPGLDWKAPAPIQLATAVGLRLRTTSTGLQDVGTRDGLRILVQAYAAWSVPKDEKAILQYLRAVRNDPDEAARQLRSFVGSAVQVTASDFDLADLVNAAPSRLQLSEFEARLRHEVEAQVRATYGIGIAEIGVERLASADLVLMSSDLRQLATAIRLSRRCRRTIAANVAIGLGWTMVMASLAAVGALRPAGAVVAALLHNVSTFATLANAGGLLTFDETAASTG